MSDFNVRADAVDVEQIMRQIRGRIREKRGVDYTEEQIQELAKVKLEKFLDPKGIRSDLLERFRRMPSDVPPTYAFDDQTLFASDKPLVRFFRKLLHPFLKLLFNPNPLNQVLHQQVRINEFLIDRTARDVLFFEVLHNLVVEVTRSSIEVKNMKMRVESIASRLEFNERRARSLEAVVQYRPDAHTGPRRDEPRRDDQRRDEPRREEGRREEPRRGGNGSSEQDAAAVDPITGGDSLRSRRRRRRRGRRSGPGFGEPGEANGTEAVMGSDPRTARGGETGGQTPADAAPGPEPGARSPEPAASDPSES